MNKIFCKNCNKELQENERPCSNCGCPNRIYKVGLMDTIRTKVGCTWKQIRPGFKRPIAEGVSRFKISRDPKLSGQEVHEEYVIDRIKKWWRQIIRDISNGKILHSEDKPLKEKQR